MLCRLFSVLFTGTLASSAFSFAAQLMLVRLLVPGDLGRLAALLAAVNFFTPIAGAGVNWFLLQAFGRDGWAALRWLRSTAILVGLATGLSAAALGIYAARTANEHAVATAFAAATILLGQVAVELASARLQLTGSFGGLALWQTVTQAGRLAVVGFVACIPVASFTTVLSGYAAVSVLTIAIGGVLLNGLWTGRVVLSGHGNFEPITSTAVSVRRAAHEAGPFALVTMFYVLYFQGVVVILEWLKGGEAAALYNAAFLILSAICLIPNVIYMKLLVAPLSRWVVHDRRTFEAAFHLGVVAMGLLGVALMVATLVAAHSVVPLLFGDRYAAAVPVLMLLALVIPIRFVQSTYSSLFISREETARKARYLAVGALATVTVSFGLIPAVGIDGAALANALAEAILLVLHIRGAARHIEGISVRAIASGATLRSAMVQMLSQAQSAHA
jgi:O-antigen/teichoic acid export membrane protein